MTAKAIVVGEGGQRKCAVCYTMIPKSQGRGRPKKYCSDSCRASAGQPGLSREATHRPRILSCQNCAEQFNRVAWNTKYCPNCRAMKGGLARPYRCDGARPKTVRWHKGICKRCHAEFQSAKQTQLYCSTACAHYSLSERAEPRKARSRAVRAEQLVYRRWARRARRIAKSRPRVIYSRECRECGVLFEATRGRQVFCGVQCATKDGRRKQRVKRRARRRNAQVEPVNSTLVHKRDGWRCQLCGVKTLRGKRGTTHPRAPELDHIDPLSRGGEHSYLNTQCACRECNHSKGDALIGQLRMFGGVERRGRGVPWIVSD